MMNHQQIIWASRRGMLELDLLLSTFAKGAYLEQSEPTQKLFQQFLTEEDQDLFNWLLRKTVPENQAYHSLITLILDNN